MKKKILWIEDGAFVELQSLTGPVYASGRYDLVMALNASEGIRQIMKNTFEAVVVDIRIPPGDDKEWINIYFQAEKNKITARLGLEVLYSLLRPDIAKVKLKKPIPAWVSPQRFGLLTVETKKEEKEMITELNITIFRQKTAELPHTALLEIITDILNNCEKKDKQGV